VVDRILAYAAREHVGPVTACLQHALAQISTQQVQGLV